MGKLILSGLFLCLLGCASTERVVPAPVVLPEAGVAISYVDMHPKIRQLAWQATEAFYRDDWRNLVDTATALEKSAGLLKNSKEPPPRLNAVLAAKCDELERESVQLRDAGQAAAIDRISNHLQRINNVVRELRPDN